MHDLTISLPFCKGDKSGCLNDLKAHHPNLSRMFGSDAYTVWLRSDNKSGRFQYWHFHAAIWLRHELTPDKIARLTARYVGSLPVHLQRHSDDAPVFLLRESTNTKTGDIGWLEYMRRHTVISSRSRYKMFKQHGSTGESPLLSAGGNIAGEAVFVKMTDAQPAANPNSANVSQRPIDVGCIPLFDNTIEYVRRGTKYERSDISRKYEQSTLIYVWRGRFRTKYENVDALYIYRDTIFGASPARRFGACAFSDKSGIFMSIFVLTLNFGASRCFTRWFFPSPRGPGPLILEYLVAKVDCFSTDLLFFGGSFLGFLSFLCFVSFMGKSCTYVQLSLSFLCFITPSSESDEGGQCGSP